jgi:hypothetical protein
MTVPMHAAVLNADTLWPVGSRIKVWLLDGDPVAHRLVQSTAVKWSQYGNISFEFYTKRPKQGSHIRVSFTGYDGSMIGVQPLSDDTEPTMRLPSVVHPKVSLDYKKRIILHEFGHLLGFEHEFRHPHWPFGQSWLKQQMIRCQELLAESHESTASQRRCQQVNQPLSPEQALWLPFDDTSIMNYPVDAQWLDNRDFPIPLTLTLSQWDKLAMGLVYPFTTESNNSPVRFYNQCHEPVVVHWKKSVREHSLSVGLQQITLGYLQRSEPLELAESSVLSFYAYDRTGRYHWRSTDKSQPLVDLNLKFKPRGERRVTFYCD